MRNKITFFIILFCGSLFAQVTKVDPARLVKPAGTANRMLITNGSSATTWGQASDLLVAGTGISVSGNTVTNTAPGHWTLSGSDVYRSSGKVIIGGSSGVGARLNVNNSDASTSLWSRAGDLVFQNSSGVDNSWAGIQVNSSGSSLAAGITFQVYDQSNSYGTIKFATRGAVNGFAGDVLRIHDGKVGIPAFTTAGNIVSHDVSGYLTSITPASLAILTNYWTLSGSDVYRSGGKVGIGPNATTPISTLHIDKTTQTIGGATPNAALVITGLSYGNYALELGTDGAAAPFIQSRNATTATYYPLLINPSGGYVGINTTGPTQPFDLAGNARFRNAVYDGTNSAGTSGYVFGTTGSATQWLSPASVVTSGLGFIQNGNSFTANAVLGTNDAYGLSIETQNVQRAFFDISGRFRLIPVASDPASPTTGDTWMNDTDDRAVHHFTNNTRRVRYIDDDTRPATVVYREDFIKTNALPTLWTYNGDASSLSATDYRYGYGSFAVSTNQVGASANGFATLSQDADLLPSTGTFTYTMSAQVDLFNVPNTTNNGDIWVGIGGGNVNSISDPDDFVGFRVNGFDGSSAKYSFVIRKNGTSTSSSGGAIGTGKRVLKIVWTNSSVSFYEDDVLLLNQTTMTNSPTGETGMGMMFKAKSAASATYPIAAVIASAIMKIDIP